MKAGDLTMTKSELYTLLEEMTPGSTTLNSSDDPAWFAHRKAEKLDDASLLSLLREIVEEHSEKSEKELRRNAYFVLAKLLVKIENPEYCQFLIESLDRETDRYVLSAMLDSIGWLRLPQEVNIDAIVKCSQDSKWLVRHSAINALRASSTDASREALRYWVRQEDERKYKYELIYAHAALGAIGTESDIALLEKHANSRIRDVRDTAAYAIENIQKRIKKHL